MSADSAAKPLTILLVEDSKSETLLIRETLKESGIDHQLHVASNGAEALRLLRERGVRPDLILLDLYMPVVDGRDTLALIKGDQRLRTIPVVIVSTSAAYEDVKFTRERQADMYCKKPLDVEAIRSVIQQLGLTG